MSLNQNSLAFQASGAPKLNSSSAHILKSYFVFMINNINYAVPISSVIGVYKMDRLSSLPSGPKLLKTEQKTSSAVYLLGISVICEQALPIVSFRQTGAEPIHIEKTGLVLVLENGIDRFGLLIDKAKGIYEIPTKIIDSFAKSPSATNLFPTYTAGVWEDGGAPIWFLNPEKMVWAEDSRPDSGDEK